MNRIWGLTTVALLALTGCASTGSTAAPTSISSTTPVASSSTAPATSSSETPAAIASSKSKIVESVCEDSTKDGDDGVDLKKARLLSDGSLLFVEYTLSGDLPVDGTVLYSVTAWSTDGNTGYQLGTKFQDGEEIANFVFDKGTSTQKNITNGAVAVDGEVNVRYPLGDLTDLGDGFTWTATVTVEGTDVDDCESTIHTNT